MDLMEYKAKELFAKFEIPIQKGVVIDGLDDLLVRTSGLSFPVVAKAQVQTGGRGKAGGIRFADNPEELAEISQNILRLNIKGHLVQLLLIVEKVEIETEWYVSIMLDRFSKSPVVIFSASGGVDIEDTARMTPDKVLKVPIEPLLGIKDYHVRYLLSKSGLGLGYFDQLIVLIKNLYSMFCACDCLLAEINPLAVTPDHQLVALDGKVTIDDSALARLPDIMNYRDALPENELVIRARKFRFLYIPCDDDGTIAVMSNGSGMIMSSIDLISKRGMTVGAALDLGGGATTERIREAIRIILANSKIKALFINIFGGITRCDEVAAGIKLAIDEQPEEKLFIVRFEGTNKDLGFAIMSSIAGHVISVDGLYAGIKELEARKDQL